MEEAATLPATASSEENQRLQINEQMSNNAKEETHVASNDNRTSSRNASTSPASMSKTESKC